MCSAVLSGSSPSLDPLGEEERSLLDVLMSIMSGSNADMCQRGARPLCDSWAENMRATDSAVLTTTRTRICDVSKLAFLSSTVCPNSARLFFDFSFELLQPCVEDPFSTSARPSSALSKKRYNRLLLLTVIARAHHHTNLIPVSSDRALIQRRPHSHLQCLCRDL